MKKVFVYICCFIFIIFEIAFLFIYFRTFSGTISQDTEDWVLFSQIANGLVITILTIINIAVFYKISISLDVKGKLFEAQSIITQMRVKQYEYLKSLIKNIQVQLIKGHIDKCDIEELKKGLMEMDNSFLYKNDKVNDPVFFKYLIEQICNDYKTKDNYQVQEKNIERAYNNLSSFLQLFEFYIIQQMMRDMELKKYIDKNKGNIDSTIACFHQMEQDFLEKMKDGDK